MHHDQGEIGETRFSAYLKPFGSDTDARSALEVAGAQLIEIEVRRPARRGQR
jgi:hypothetical protein